MFNHNGTYPINYRLADAVPMVFFCLNYAHHYADQPPRACPGVFCRGLYVHAIAYV